MNKTIFAFVILFTSAAFAHLPSANLILQRTIENNGIGAYLIETELQCAVVGQDAFILKEAWLVLGENQMRLSVVGTGELKDKLKITQIYNKDKRWQLSASGKRESSVGEDFLERYHHFRDMSSFAGALVKMNILNQSSLQKKVLKDVESYKPDPLVRLARVSGVMAYAFGESTMPDKSSAPGLWIEQDQFFIRKIRTPSGAEMSIDSAGTYAKGLVYPKARSIKWGNQQCQLTTISVSPKTGTGLSSQVNPQALDQISFVDISDGATKTLIEEFYSRFR